MKVLLAACFYMHNYGSQLQAIASEYILTKFADEVKVVNCVSPKMFMTESKFCYYMKRLCSKYSVQNQLAGISAKVKSKADKEYGANLKKRVATFNKYIDNHYSLTEEVKDIQSFRNLTEKYDAIVVGSDMLWNPINVDQNYYTLNHACDEIRKISLATSIGTSVLPQKDIAEYRHFLSRFYTISAREESAVKLINEVLGCDKAKLLLDPTLQLTADEWNQILKCKLVDISEKYIFAYFLGKNSSHRDVVKAFAEKYNLKIVSITHVDGYTRADENFGDIQLFDCDPEQFVEYIKRAEFVFTDSFHCCTFSIIYGKQFYVFNRFSEHDKVRNNTRIDSLLDLTRLERQRISSVPNEIEPIDYERVYSIINDQREVAFKFLKDSLNYDK